MGRAKFLESEDRDMWRFLYTELKKRNASATTPCGNTIWEKFISLGKSDRSATNLCSHFRKKMFGNLHVAPLKLDEKIFIYKSLNIKIDNRVKYTLEAAHKIRIKFKPFGQIPIGYENEDDDDVEEQEVENASEESDTDDSIHLDENVPGGSKDNGVNSGAKTPSSINKVSNEEKKKNATPSLDSVLDPDISLVDPEDHDYTREIREVKAQCRVRHGFPKLLDSTQLEDGEQPAKRRNTGSVPASAEEQVQEPFDLSFESPREMEVDLNLGLVVNHPATFSAELQDGQHELMMAENEIPSTTSPYPNNFENGHEDVALDVFPDDSSEDLTAFRSKFRTKLLELCQGLFGGNNDVLVKEINLLETGIYKKAKSYNEYKSAMLKQAKMFVSTEKTFRNALSDDPPSTASNPTIRLAMVDTKIDAGERKTAVLQMVSQFDKFPMFYLAIACDLIKAAESCAAFQAVDKKDYDDWMKTFNGGIKNSLRELIAESR